MELYPTEPSPPPKKKPALWMLHSLNLQQFLNPEMEALVKGPFRSHWEW